MAEWLEALDQLCGRINCVLWGVPMMALLLAAGIYLTWRTGGVQFRRFGASIRVSLGGIFRRQRAAPGAVPPFQALATALAATVGTGNIVGVGQAIAMGGPGAIFWMWVSALIGMALKYAEVLLAVRYRRRNAAGEWVGGPMYYMTAALGKKWKPMAAAFALFGGLAAFGIGNIAQGNNIARSVNTALAALLPQAPAESMVSLAVGVLLAVLLGLTLLGGMKRLGRVTSALVPLVSLGYIFSALAVICLHWQNLLPALGNIFRCALAPEAALGGVTGFTMSRAIAWGCRRGIFTNEAGLGSAPIAHAAADASSPVEQGLRGVFEVFADTIVICTFTALAILTSGISIPWGADTGSELVAAAFATVYGGRASAVILAVCMALFAFPTLLSWSFYGRRCAEYLLGERFGRAYEKLFILVALLGCVMDLSLAWRLSDTLNGLMALPNLAALLVLGGTVGRLTREEERLRK